MNDTKKLIIEKTLHLFIKHGFNGVSLRDIIKEIGLSRGIFYYYFESKEECFEECIKYFFEQTQSADVEDSSVSLKDYIELMLARLAVVYQDYEFLDRISFINEARKISKNFNEYIKFRSEKELSACTKVISNAIQKGEIKNIIPSEDAAKLFIHQCDGIVLGCNLTNTQENLLNEIRNGWEIIYNILKK